MSSRSKAYRRMLPFAAPAVIGIGLAIMVGSQSGHESGTSSAKSPTGQDSGKSLMDGNLDASRMPRANTLVTRAANRLPEDPTFRELVREAEAGHAKLALSQVQEIASKKIGDEVALSIGQSGITGKVTASVHSAGMDRMALQLENGKGVCVITLREDHTIMAHVMFNGESQALVMRGMAENGEWPVAVSTVEQVLCAPAGSTYPPRQAMPRIAKSGKSTPSNAGKPINAPDLSSDPDSPFVFYMDFDGETVNNPEWTIFTGGPIVCLPSPRANDEGYITRIWQRVVEDFAGFNVNVTTDRTVYDEANPSQRMMCVMTPTDDAAPGAGGVALLESFGFDIPCFAYNDTEASAAETVSHEIGHTLGLLHDGQVNGFEYYGGQGTGAVSWAPIMGAYFADFEPPFVEEELTQWSKGEYPDANNQEDDLAIISNARNGFGYRDDDHGNTSGAATFVLTQENVVDVAGTIERNTDEDWFTIATSGGTVNLDVKALDVDSPEDEQRGANLAVAITLYDSDGNIVQGIIPQDMIDASISRQLPEGVYYLKVEGAGRGDLETGFSDYASLGHYTITGTLPQNNLISVDPTSMNIPRAGGKGSFIVSNASEWTWSTDAPWIKSEQPSKLFGRRSLIYTVDRNAGREARVAEIVVTDGLFSAIHTVYQTGSENDDHGDTFDEATLVEDQTSSTPGVLEEAGDIDMFMIRVDGFGKLTVSASGATDTIADFYDGNGVKLQSDDESLSPNFEMTQSVSNGFYYVAVRHAVDGGVGAYTFNSSFKPTSALEISPKKRRVGPSGGNFFVEVISNREWTWSADTPWLALAPSGTQDGGQILPYRVLPNNTNRTREAKITFRNKGNKVVHTIIQTPANGDDHADSRSKASKLTPNGNQEGQIQFEGDADMFRMELGTSGFLSIRSSGSIDSVGEVLDADGKSIVAIDEGNGDDFVIQREMGAGVYYLRVKSFGAEVGSYSIRTNYQPSELIEVDYQASRGGVIRGEKIQSVPLGMNAGRVRAVPNRGYSFVQWSDGQKQASRRDLGLLTHLKVTAQFAPTLQVSYSGKNVRSNATTPVDYGILKNSKGRSITFRIRNNGNQTLTDLAIDPSASTSPGWKITKVSRRNIPAGKSARVTIRLNANQPGFQSATYSIQAKGMNRPFLLKTMGVVGSSLTATSSPKRMATTPKISSDAASIPWIEVSPDGYFRYRFERDRNDESEQIFWISADGTTWEEALVLDVWKTHTTDSSNHFEAILAPPSVPVARVLVIESVSPEPQAE